MTPRGQGLASKIDTSEAARMPLNPGQMSLHHTKLSHASFNNNGNQRRIGFGISYIPTSIEDIGDTRAHGLLVRSTDNYKHFLEEECLCHPQTKTQMAYHLKLMKQFRKRQDQGDLYSKPNLNNQ